MKQEEVEIIREMKIVYNEELVINLSPSKTITTWMLVYSFCG